MTTLEKIVEEAGAVLWPEQSEVFKSLLNRAYDAGRNEALSLLKIKFEEGLSKRGEEVLGDILSKFQETKE